MHRQPIVLGTHNSKKLRELKYLLEAYSFDLKSLAEVNSIEVEETGTSFEENARLKAVEQARHLNQWVIAEDSGLSVTVLQGRPGVYSARYSGKQATDESNNKKLIDELSEVPVNKRDAFYTCHIVLSDPGGKVHLSCESKCHGRIRFKPAGNGGFGYDPLFEIREYGKTFGEMGDEVKGILSHRARAVRQFVSQLKEFDFENC